MPRSESIPPPSASLESVTHMRTALFEPRARRDPARYAQALWADALTQASDGWLTPPDLLPADGTISPLLWGMRYRFFLYIPENDKIRRCGDLKGSLTNAMCTVFTPITLCGWGHISEASHLLRDRPRDWAFGKVCRKSAWEFLPVLPADSRSEVNASWKPKDEARYFACTRAQLFGIAASVLHYNCAPGINLSTYEGHLAAGFWILRRFRIFNSGRYRARDFAPCYSLFHRLAGEAKS